MHVLCASMYRSSSLNEPNGYSLRYDIHECVGVTGQGGTTGGGVRREGGTGSPLVTLR